MNYWKNLSIEKKITCILILVFSISLIYIIIWRYQIANNKQEIASLESEIFSYNYEDANVIETNSEVTNITNETNVVNVTTNNTTNTMVKNTIVAPTKDTVKLTPEEARKADFEKLLRVNPDVKGWIKIASLGISYPIVQYKNNDYYLTRDIYRRNNVSGSIFIDYRNHDFEDTNTIIYGHNMKNDSMFGKLDMIREGVVGKNIEIVILTSDATYKYDVFSAYEIKPEEFDMNASLKSILNKSEIDFEKPIQKEDKYITLFTCTDSAEKRTVVHAYLKNDN